MGLNPGYLLKYFLLYNIKLLNLFQLSRIYNLLYNLFSAHGVVLVTGICFVFFFVPETRGLTLTQLTTLFGGKLADDGITSTGIFFQEPVLFFFFINLS